MTTDPYELYARTHLDDPYADGPAPQRAPRPLTPEVAALARALHAGTARVTLTLGGYVTGHVCATLGCCIHIDYDRTGALRGERPFHVDLGPGQHADLSTLDECLAYTTTLTAV